VSLRAVVVESLCVLVAGVALGLGVNAARDRGLDLGRDHFPKRTPSPTSATPSRESEAYRGAASATPDEPVAPATDAHAADADGTNASEHAKHVGTSKVWDTPLAIVGALDPAVEARAIDRLHQKGLAAIQLDELREFLADPMLGYGLYMLIDARRPRDFAAGHLPGARHYDPYYPEQVDEVLLSELQAASRVVVYCNGGDCEDSESAALQLLGAGVPAEAIQVYVGGISEWLHHDLPLEVPGEEHDG